MLSLSGEFLTPMASIWSVRIMWSLVVSGGHRDLNAVVWSGVVWSGLECCQHGVTWTIERSHHWLLAVSLSLSRHHRPTLES